MGNKDLRLPENVYKLVFYKISFSLLLPLDGFHFIFSLCEGENDLYLGLDLEPEKVVYSGTSI